MSDEKEPVEENPSDDFEFYFSFTKALVLELPTSEEKAIGAAWVQKLESDTEDKERINYLKLLLFILQRGRLSGIFKNQPPSGPFEPFPPGFSIIDMGNLMLDQDDCQIFGGGDTRAVPYNIEISNDLREFVASQEVPKFGIQMYYAWSADDTIQKWSQFDENKFPQYILDKMKQLEEERPTEKLPKTTCKKKTMDIGQGEKCLKNKVKTPQEIEKTQGRSFHTYMGLVGRMGNYSKCEDDQERECPRSPSGKGTPQRKKMQRPPTGECEMEGAEDYENLVSGLGGELTSMNRPCLCPYPCHHQNCPDYRTGPQSLEAQSTGTCPADQGYGQQCSRQVRQTSPRRNVRDATPDMEMMTQQQAQVQRCGATATRNDMDMMTSQQVHVQVQVQRCGATATRTDMDMMTSQVQVQRCGATATRTPEVAVSVNVPQGSQGTPRGSGNRGGTCLCSSAQCLCPCPRGSCPTPAPKTPTCSSQARVPGNASQTFVRTSPQNSTRFANTSQGRAGGEFLNSFKAPDNFGDRQCPLNNSPMGGRTSAPAEKSLRPVTHCYDERNPDPALTEVVNRQPAAAVPYAEPQAPAACTLAPPAQDACFKARRTLFKPLAESTLIRDRPPRPAGAVCPPPSPAQPPAAPPATPTAGPPATSPALMIHPECENETPASDQFLSFIAEDETESVAQCSRVAPGTYKKQNVTAGSQGNRSLFAVNESSGRLANIASVLQGLQQKTEAHREKIASGAVRKSPDNAGACPIQQATTQGANQMDYDAGGNYPPNQSLDPNFYYSPQSQVREPAPREPHSDPSKRDESIMFMSNQLAFQGPLPDSQIKYFPTSTPPLPRNQIRFDEYMTMEQATENECTYEEVDEEGRVWSEPKVSQITPRYHSAPCPTTESIFYSPPKARQRPEETSHYTPQVKFQQGNRSRPQSPRSGSSPRRSPNAGACRLSPQAAPSSPQHQSTLPTLQCQPPTPPQQSQPQGPTPPCQAQTQGPTPPCQVQTQCPLLSRKANQRQSPTQSARYLSPPTPYGTPAEYLSPQCQTAGNVRPQAASTGERYQTGANLNCARPPTQPVSRRISFDETGECMQDLSGIEEDDFENNRSSSLFVEMDSYLENEPDLGEYGPMSSC